MIYLFPAFAFGYLLCWSIMRLEVQRLKSEKEKQRSHGCRTTEQLANAYLDHLETHHCVFIGKEDQILEAEYVE